MPLTLTYRWKEQDKAVKLVGNSAESRTLAQWPKRLTRVLVEVVRPQQMKRSPRRFLLKKCAGEQLLRLRNPAEGDFLRSLWMKARFQNRYWWCRFSFHWFNQINDSSQISSIWQECLSLGSWYIRLSITISLIPASWRRKVNAKGGSYKWTECTNCFQSAIYTICST